MSDIDLSLFEDLMKGPDVGNKSKNEHHRHVSSQEKGKRMADNGNNEYWISAGRLLCVEKKEEHYAERNGYDWWEDHAPGIFINVCNIINIILV